MSDADPGMYGSAANKASDLLYEVAAWLHDISTGETDGEAAHESLIGRLAPAADAALAEARALQSALSAALAAKEAARQERSEMYRDMERVRTVLYGTDWAGADPVTMRDELRRALCDDQVVVDVYERAERAEAQVRAAQALLVDRVYTFDVYGDVCIRTADVAAALAPVAPSEPQETP